MFLKNNEGLTILSEPPAPPALTNERPSGYSAGTSGTSASVVLAAEKESISSLFDSLLARQRARLASQEAPESDSAATAIEEEEVANRNKIDVIAMMTEFVSTLHAYEAKRQKMTAAVSKMMDRARASQVVFAEDAARKEKQFEIAERLSAARAAGARSRAPACSSTTVEPQGATAAIAANAGGTNANEPHAIT